MIAFWVSAIILTLLATLFVAWPLLSTFKTTSAIARKNINISIFEEHLRELDELHHNGDIDDQQYQTQKKELENTLWEDVQVNDAEFNQQTNKNGLLVLAIIIPLCAFALYGLWGNLNEVKLSNAIERSVMAPSSEERDHAHQEVISILEKNTQTQPDNFDDWFLLGEFYVQTKNYQGAAEAFGRAVSIQSNNAEALAQYAQALYFAGNNKLTFAVTSTAEQALKIDPDQPTALGLLGIAAFENKQYSKAINYWQKILWIVGDQDAGASSLKNGIDFAKSFAQKQGQWLSINVKIKIDPSITVTPSQWIFVYAREPNTRKPVAIVRMKADQLPSTVVLDDTTTMPNGALLSSVGKVEVVVRLSDTGSAEPSATDKTAVSRVISPNAKGENITLLLK